MNLLDSLLWRYQLYVKPHFMLHESFCAAAMRVSSNWLKKHTPSPVCYIFADATNIGDRISASGVSYLAEGPGIEVFAARAGLKTTFRTLRWLEEHRPDTRVLIGGGGLLQECFDPFWKELVSINLPFALFGVGANEMPGARSISDEGILKTLSERALAIHVRDERTQRLLQHGQGVPVTVGVCPSVNYLVWKFGNKQNKTRTHLLHVTHPVDVDLAGGDPELHRQRVKDLARIFGLSYDETDHIKQDLASLVERYHRARFVVSSRLHGCIFSFALGVPFVPIVLDRKTEAFLETHISMNPSVGVDLSQTEVAEKLLEAEKNGQKSVDLCLGAIDQNVSVMRKIMSSFRETN